MSLSPGIRIGSYEIRGLLGSGGMGEVYRARDGRLQREVAIKVLPAAFASDPDRLARFEREAQVLASLNHPHIGAIYGFEEGAVEAGLHVRALVLELVDGPTLADRIAQGPLPLDEALPIARQIAEALEAAHEQGIIHRDLKPANIKLRPDGTVKVLDFGLAKLNDPAVSNASNGPKALSMSPTITSPALMTEGGVILGTAAYMSPEQARGKPVDKRTDIWAFGCVLYEMLAGKRPFSGDTVTEVLASVVSDSADLAALPPGLPPRLRHVVARTLERNPRDRFRDIGDLRYELEHAVTDSPHALGTLQTTPRRRMTPWLAAAAIAGSVGGGGLVWTLAPSVADPSTRFVHVLPARRNLSGGYAVAVSPDGNQFVYADRAGGLYVRSKDELDPRIVPGTEGLAQSPSYSLDGQWIAYQSGRRLLKIPRAGGTPTILCETAFSAAGIDWIDSNTILYAQRDGIWRVSAAGGQPSRILDYDHAAAGAAFRHPQILPGRGALLYVSVTSDIGRLRVRPRDGEPYSEISRAIQARYLPTGHLVTLGADGVLSAVRFDVETLRPSGQAVPLERGVAQFAVSRSGTLVYTKAPESTTPLTRLALVDRRGRVEVISEPGRFLHPRFSPDGARIALQIDENDRSNVFVFERSSHRLRQLTFDGGRVPVWTPTGREITFIAGEALWNVASDFTGRPTTLSTASQRFGIAPPFDWSPDGKVLFWDGAGGVAQLTLGSDGSATHGPLLVEAYSEGHPSFSRDGRWFAYNADETGRSELYIQPYPPDLGARRQITRAGGVAPMWVRNGEIVYENGNDLWSIRVSTSPTLSWDDPLRLIEKKWRMAVGPYRNYDVSPDGSRFLVLEPAETIAETADRDEIVVVLNWLREVTQQVPID